MTPPMNTCTLKIEERIKKSMTCDKKKLKNTCTYLVSKSNANDEHSRVSDDDRKLKGIGARGIIAGRARAVV
jgi:hypothetical protein